MNCNNYRSLIQQRFDQELSSREEELLLTHIGECESCAYFENQIAQVIQGVREIPPPAEVIPEHLDSLAQTILQHLPPPKPSFLTFLSQWFRKKDKPVSSSKNKILPILQALPEPPDTISAEAIPPEQNEPALMNWATPIGSATPSPVPAAVEQAAPEQVDSPYSWDEPPAETGFVGMGKGQIQPDLPKTMETAPASAAAPAEELNQPARVTSLPLTNTIISRLSNILEGMPVPSPENTSTTANQPDDYPSVQERLHQEKLSAPPAAPAPPTGRLFNQLDDHDIERLFKENLGIKEMSPAVSSTQQPPSAIPVSSDAVSPAPALPPASALASSKPTPPPFPTASPTEQTAPTGRLFKDLDDQAIDRLFQESLGITESALAARQVTPAAPQAGSTIVEPGTPLTSPTSPVIPERQSVPSPSPQFSFNPETTDLSDTNPLKSKFNQAVKSLLNAASTAPLPKIEGIGKLDSHIDNQADTGSGKIASIGKFLLDQQDLETIGKLAASDLTEAKLRILTLDAAQDLQNILSYLGKQPGVAGSVIVGHDGLLIANSMPVDIDPESIGVLALGIYLNTQNVTKKMQHEKINQIVSRTDHGYVIIANFGTGLLVTMTNDPDTGKLIPVMRSISKLVS